MPIAILGGLAAAVEPSPSPSPTARVLEDWEVTPGLEGFLATFGIALAAVLLFLSLSKHMRKANAYARANGIEVPERKGIGFRRDEPADVGADADAAASPAAVASPVVPSDADPGGTAHGDAADGGSTGEHRPPAAP